VSRRGCYSNTRLAGSASKLGGGRSSDGKRGAQCQQARGYLSSAVRSSASLPVLTCMAATFFGAMLC
jgi:hypothetical protein